MKNIRPVYIVSEPGVPQPYLDLVVSGIRGVLEFAGVENRVQVLNLGVWRDTGYRQVDQLLPHASVDWYIARGRRLSHRQGQVNGGAILDALTIEPRRELEPHFDIMILRSDLRPDEPNMNYVFGLSLAEVGSVISMHRFDTPSDEFESLVAHEFAHVLGVVSDESPQYDRGNAMHGHCTQQCLMRAANGYNDLARNLALTRQNGMFCPHCREDLRRYFL